MPTGRQIIETAIQMSLADLSVLVSAVQQENEDVVVVTAAGSANDRFWYLMAEKGWMIDCGNPRPDLPIAISSYSIRPEFRSEVAAVAVVCFEGLQRGMAPEEIVAFGDGKSDGRLAHLL